ncbi:MAG: hypothetical protein ACR2NG_06905 [Acidimicrobiia bacterium]
MPDIDRRVLIGATIAGIVLLLGAFFIGRATAGGGEAAAPVATTTSLDDGSAAQSDTTSSTSSDTAPENSEDGSGDPSAALLHDEDRPEDLPEYGTEQDRSELIDVLAEAGIGMGTRETVLWVADSVCYDLERLQAQDRSAAFAVRVVWNETLADLDSADAAAFGAVFNAAPFFLCLESVEYATEVAYWLGI